MSYDRSIIEKEIIKEAIEKTHSMAAAARYLHVSRDRFNRYAKLYGLFKPNQSGKGVINLNERKYTNDDIFKEHPIKISQNILIHRLKELREWKCEKCGIYEWMGSPITLEIHHIDGNRLNNNLDNLQILCPNCHSQTNNWRSRNQKGYCKTKPKVSDEEILEAIKTHSSIFDALKSLGLAGGSNYVRVYKLLKENIDIIKE